MKFIINELCWLKASKWYHCQFLRKSVNMVCRIKWANHFLSRCNIAFHFGSHEWHYFTSTKEYWGLVIALITKLPIVLGQDHTPPQPFGYRWYFEALLMIHGMISLKINYSLKLHHVTTAHVTLTRWIVIVGLRLWLVQFWRAVFNEINKVPSVAIATPHHSTSPLPLTHPSPLPLTPSPHHSLKGPNQTKIFVKSHLFMSLNLCRTFLSLKTFSHFFWQLSGNY